ncbi:MAG: GIY-YIG nuclease family protein [Cyanomargarita calcarea GSE-NOS-MK-12-04C]|uniref:GIY-YIG nuclease family protein n=1 Tax=Cyanomargarita calcarea GSE-NOS-MK-12-04C TaxID=2839659 RepID=A0A951UTD4_9CYAN|nr:GIY-YIG nuclease family protein [Cyanomargarita calcarea GSE-NOS-MK-12-04C]
MSSPKTGHIYFIHAVGTSRYKIGLTTRSVKERLDELNSSQSAYPLQLIASAKFSNVWI